MEEIKTKINDKELSRYEMLESFLSDDALNDVTLKGTDGFNVQANKFLLAARSKVFRGMILGKFQEAASPVVELGYPGNVLKAVVEYILTDSAEMLICKKPMHDETPSYDFKQVQGLVSLMEAASYFNLPGLGKLVAENFQQLWATGRFLSFAIFQACRVAGPSVPANLVIKAKAFVQSTPFESITSNAVACVSDDVMEEIMKDSNMEMTEFELFWILTLWVKTNDGSPSDQKDRKNRALCLSQHIFLEKISPSHLSNTVSSSGIVTIEQLCEAYKNQALVSDRVAETPRQSWMKKLPQDLFGNSVYPSAIKLDGAGVDAVNGTYVRDKTFKGVPKYSMEGSYKSSPCIFWIACWASGWYITIPDQESPGGENDIDFYCAEWCHIPPHEGWVAKKRELSHAQNFLPNSTIVKLQFGGDTGSSSPMNSY